ncbi:MAG: PEP-CTERM sorting domain-containing protein [Okeania sp. SIO2D1]|nr:PEP-CTERM sorting domain-containing protein [Okeania sp. SIO2D1]
MNSKFLSTALLATATLATVGMFAPQASATSLVPQMETEIDVDLGCLDPDPDKCIDKGEFSTFLPWIANISSLVDATTGEKSRLFVDHLATKSTYTDGDTLIRFKSKDAGTNPDGYWFRPSEVNEEKGQLEVGTFQFDFTKTIRKLTIDFFDTEKANSTGILAINGVELDQPIYIADGPNGNIAEEMLFDVNSITLKLGNDKLNSTGDGVDFRLHKDVPEPTTALGLLVVGALGAASARKRGQKQ